MFIWRIFTEYSVLSFPEEVFYAQQGNVGHRGENIFGSCRIGWT